MRVLFTTRLGRLQLALTAVLLPLLAVKMVMFNGNENPSLGTSFLFNAGSPLLVVHVMLGFAARGILMRRDWLVFAMAMGAADARRLGRGRRSRVRHRRLAARPDRVFLGLTIVCLIWSAAGRRPRTA